MLRNQLQFAFSLGRVDVEVRRHGDACEPRAFDQRRQEQLKTDQLNWLAAEQMTVLPQVAGTGFDRGVVFGTPTELGQRRERRQRAQDAIVLVTHAAAPAAVGQLVVRQPAQRRREPTLAPINAIGQPSQPGGVVGNAADAGPARWRAKQVGCPHDYAACARNVW